MGGRVMNLHKTLAAAGTICALAVASAAAAQDAAPVEASATAAEAPPAPPARPSKPTVASLTVELQAAQARIAELEAAGRRQALALDNARAEVQAQRDAAVLRDELLVLGRERNATLFGLAKEILDRYANAGVTERLSRREPFVQAKRVALENEVQAYEDRLRASRLLESTLPPSVEKRMQEDLARARAADPAAAPTDAAPTPQ